MTYDIIALPREKWKDHVLPIGYTTERYYGVSIESGESFTVRLREKIADPPITHTPEEYGYPDRLYEDHWKDAFAWGIVRDGRLLAAIETCPEEWSNRLRITELWVDESMRCQGVGRTLVEIAKEQARLERRRSLILETQSCNYNAIGFYRHMGFSLIGFDACCYANNDLTRHEVRLEFCILYDKPEKLARGAVEIRPELPEDYGATERMVRRAFFNKFQPGCNEHYLIHIMRSDAAYLPELSRIAVADGKVVGCIMYTKSRVEEREVVTFGPLAVDPDYQGRGIGGMLLTETLPLARAAGFSGVVIFGEPDYYPRYGFVTCDQCGITTPDGRNFPSFMCYKLNDTFDDIRGRFFEAELFGHLDGAAAFDERFPPRAKYKFPRQL